MDFGINLATSADSWKIVKRAEELGYARAWFYDTQLLNADMFVAMGAAAVQTARIRLATGVEEHAICTADLIRTMTFTGTRPALRDRLRELRAAGYNHFAISIRHGHPAMLEEWADVFEGV